MGLFEEAGRRFERFKREATAAAQRNAEYECAACGERVFTDVDRCPECGAGDLDAIEPDDDTAETKTDDTAESDDGGARELPSDDERR